MKYLLTEKENLQSYSTGTVIEANDLESAKKIAEKNRTFQKTVLVISELNREGLSKEWEVGEDVKIGSISWNETAYQKWNESWEDFDCVGHCDPVCEDYEYELTDEEYEAGYR